MGGLKVFVVMVAVLAVLAGAGMVIVQLLPYIVVTIAIVAIARMLDRHSDRSHKAVKDETHSPDQIRPTKR